MPATKTTQDRGGEAETDAPVRRRGWSASVMVTRGGAMTLPTELDDGHDDRTGRRATPSATAIAIERARRPLLLRLGQAEAVFAVMARHDAVMPPDSGAGRLAAQDDGEEQEQIEEREGEQPPRRQLAPRRLAGMR